jgi:hypothetical protein
VADDLSAALAEIRERHRNIDCAAAAYLSAGDVPRLLALAGAALKHHRPEPLYGNASTEGEPGACPHDPDSPLHFEADDGSGEWLCEGRPEGVVCSCTESADGEQVPWPCDEVADILAALTGKEAGSGAPVMPESRSVIVSREDLRAVLYVPTGSIPAAIRERLREALGEAGDEH